MDFIRESIEKLRSYAAKKESIENTAREIERLREEASALRSGLKDSPPVAGGNNSHEDRIVGLIAEQMEIEAARKSTLLWLETMDKVLEALDPADRHILDLMYIHRKKGNVERLCEELCCEKPTVYRRRNAAVKHFAYLYYGVTGL